MSVSLFLNKINIDLSPKPITRKIQIGDIGDINARKSSFSYTIKIPSTSRNIEALEMLGVIGNASRKPFETVVCDYVVDGVYLIENGFAVIKSSKTKGYFDLNLIDGFKGLAELLKGKKIADLPLDDLSHILTTQAYIDSYSNIEGFIYCIGDFGQGVSSAIKVEKQAPSIFVHTLFRRIFEDAGLNLQGEFFTTNDKYLNEVITPVKGYDIIDSGVTSTAKGGADTDVLNDYRTENSFIEIYEKFTFTDLALVGASVVDGDIVFSVAGTYKMEIETTYGSFDTYLNLVFKVNGAGKAHIFIPEGNSQTKSSEVTFIVEAGDVVSLYLQGSSAFSEEEFGQFTISYSISCDTLLFLQTGGQLIQASDFIGDMNQLDFVKDIINRYGLLLHPVKSTNDYVFKRIEVLLNDRAGAEDWTDKVSIIESEDYNSGYKKTNKAKYNYPEAIVIPNNDGEMIIDNENTGDEKTMFSSSFEIPVNSSEIDGNETFLIPIWALEDAVLVNKETPLKVMSIKRIDTSITAKLFAEVTGITETENIPFLSLDNISMQFFLGNYYRAFQSLINNYKEVSLKMNLSIVDIFNLDFFRLKYLKQTGHFYYLQTIKNTTGKLSSVKMIEISEFLENQPPSQIGNFEFNMNHLASRTITLDNLKTGYEDPELDEPYKIKIISGFNANVLLKQNGVTLVAETEIDVSVLDLVAVEVLGGASAYSESWVFAIADNGSKTYGTQTGNLTANVLSFVNQPPVANAGTDQSFEFPSHIFDIGETAFPLLNGSASYDLTGEIVSYVWEIQSEPASSNAFIQTQDSLTPVETLELPIESDNVGTYVLKLTVTDEFGASDTDTMEVELSVEP